MASYPENYPTVMLIDANRESGQSAARLLTLANFRVLYTRTLAAALQRLQSNNSPKPHALLTGAVEDSERSSLAQFAQSVEQMAGRRIPVLQCAPLLDEQLLMSDPAVSPFVHTFSTLGRAWLMPLWNLFPDMRIAQSMKNYTLVLDALPPRGLDPRVTRKKASQNQHFRQLLLTARQVIPPDQWDTVIHDVGLGEYVEEKGWPPDNDYRAILPEYISCLQQAVSFSAPADPAAALWQWGARSAQALREQRVSLVARMRGDERSITGMLRRLTEQLDAIRGEELHAWLPWPDGSYWLVLYSNLYIYGRAGLAAPGCQVWWGILDATLRALRLDDSWMTQEVECSGETQSGHCIFVLRKR